MTEIKNKIQRLKELRDLAGLTAPKPEWLKINREVLLMQVRNNIGHPRESFSFNKIWRGLNIFLPPQFVGYVVRPIIFIGILASTVFGGWITTVYASYNSLPGDVLYPIKLAAENVQTSLANKPQEIKLRMENAGRRAGEVNKIVKNNLPKKEVKVEEAVKHLKDDLEVVKVNLDSIKQDSATGKSAETVEIAKAVDQKSIEIQKTLDQIKTDMAANAVSILALNAPVTAETVAAGLATDKVEDQVKKATAVMVEIGVKAVEVIVEKHQVNSAVIGKEEIKNLVDNKINALEVKVVGVEMEIKNMAVTSTAAVIPTKEEKKAQDVNQKIMEPVKISTEAAKTELTQAKESLAKEDLTGAMDSLKKTTILTQTAEIKVEASKVLTAAVEAATVSGKTSSTVSGGVSGGVSSGVLLKTETAGVNATQAPMVAPTTVGTSTIK